MGTASSPFLGRRARRLRPGVEMLETRLVPAVTIQKVDLDGDSNPANDGAAGVDDFLIIGDSRNTVVQIDDNGTSLSVDIDFNGDGTIEITNQTSTASSGTITVELRLGGGRDTVQYRLVDNLDGDRRTVLADLGSGNDKFTFLPQSKDLRDGTLMVFDVLGRGGADTLDLPLAFDDLKDSDLIFTSDLGGGNDAFQPILSAQNVDNFRLQLKSDLGAGNNTALVQIGAVDSGLLTPLIGDIDIIGSNSALNVDKVTVNLNSVIHGGGGRLSIGTRLQAGNDQFTCNLKRGTLQFLDDCTVTVNVDAGTGNDTVAVNAVGSGQIVWGSLPVLSNVLALNFLGGAGKDRITVDLFATNLLNMRGRFNIAIEGGAGADQITIQLQSDSGSDGNYQISALAGDGNDLVTVDFDLNGAGATFNPIGFVLLNGGAGKDTLDDTAGGPPSTSEGLFEVQI